MRHPWRWLARGGRFPWNRPVPGVEDTGLIGWMKPQAPGAGEAAGPPPKTATPAPGHHRGDHMVIDVWEDGCIYTWTRKTGWVHDTRCIDEELRKLTAP